MIRTVDDDENVLTNPYVKWRSVGIEVEAENTKLKTCTSISLDCLTLGPGTNGRGWWNLIWPPAHQPYQHCTPPLSRHKYQRTQRNNL